MPRYQEPRVSPRQRRLQELGMFKELQGQDTGAADNAALVNMVSQLYGLQNEQVAAPEKLRAMQAANDRSEAFLDPELAALEANTGATRANTSLTGERIKDAPFNREAVQAGTVGQHLANSTAATGLQYLPEQRRQEAGLRQGALDAIPKNLLAADLTNAESVQRVAAGRPQAEVDVLRHGMSNQDAQLKLQEKQHTNAALMALGNLYFSSGHPLPEGLEPAMLSAGDPLAGQAFRQRAQDQEAARAAERAAHTAQMHAPVHAPAGGVQQGIGHALGATAMGASNLGIGATNLPMYLLNILGYAAGRDKQLVPTIPFN